MGLRTIYGPPSHSERRQPIRGGDFGDHFTADVIREFYKVTPTLIDDEGRRLLVTGSIAHHVRPGDVLCGVGNPGTSLPHPRETEGIRILGLRGPLTYEAFRVRGHDLSELRFMKDPGLLVRFMVGSGHRPKPEGASFLPHQREPLQHIRRSLPRGIRLLVRRLEPLKVADDILKSELVYTSSLHGIIFCHALERPCVFVRPQTTWSMLKYADYFASIDRPLPPVLSSISDARFHRTPDSPIELKLAREEFAFPSLEELEARGVFE